MRYLKILYLLIGVALLAAVLYETDLAEVADLIGRVGPIGLLTVMAVYFAVFSIDTLTWQMAIPSVPLNLSWLCRFWQVRLVGEAFNVVMPAGGMGGEPVKAVMLKKHYGIGYGEGMASIILGRTINMLSLIPFFAVGFLFMLISPTLGLPYKVTGGVGILGFIVATGIVFGVQWLPLSAWAAKWPGDGAIAQFVVNSIEHLRAMEDRFIRFYTHHHARFGFAVLLSLLQWCVGALEVYYALYFLGHPVSLGDAVMIEAVAQLIRAGTFFIPANIGAQEGGFLIMCTAITGSPALGLATALLRRFRELIWIVSGFALGLLYSVRPVPWQSEHQPSIDAKADSGPH